MKAFVQNLWKIVKWTAITVCAAAVLGAIGWSVWQWQAGHAVPQSRYQTPEEAGDIYVRFSMEAYDSILDNFWNKLSDAQLSSLYQAALQDAAKAAEPLATTTRAGTATMLEAAFRQVGSSTVEKALMLNTLETVLYNGLPPLGHNNLDGTVQQTELKNTVANINPNNDLYQNLGLAGSSTIPEVEAAYARKQAALAGTTSPQGLAELKQAAYAETVLTKPAAKAQYDENKVEPTVFVHAIGSHTLYLYVNKIAPTTIIEFARAIEDASSTPGLTGMILDLRGNVGGDLSFAQNLMSLFLGPNQYVYDLYHQGAYDAQRTPAFAPLPALARYKEIAVLTSSTTQSTAELTASTLRQHRLAHVIGTKTAGWGSVESEFPLQTVIDPHEQYALRLVEYLTLGGDQQPIEQNGVKPDIDMSLNGWQSRLSDYFDSASLIAAIVQVAAGAPLR